MALDVEFAFRGCTVKLTNQADCLELNLNLQILEHLSADELAELFDWYRRNYSECRTVFRWQEYDYGPQWREKFSDAELEVVLASEFSSDDDRSQAESILARRRNVRPVGVQKIAQGGFVYLMHSSSGHYKIGASANPQSRLRSLRTASPFVIRLLHTVHTGDMYEAEKTLHTRYAGKRVNNEWFELSDFDVQAILALTNYGAGRFS